jgi:hypothetical protein
VYPAALKEAMLHHTVAKHKKDDRQEDYKQELSGSECGGLWLLWVRRIPGRIE